MGDGPERIEEFPTLPDGVQPAPKAFLDEQSLRDGVVAE